MCRSLTQTPAGGWDVVCSADNDDHGDDDGVDDDDDDVTDTWH